MKQNIDAVWKAAGLRVISKPTWSNIPTYLRSKLVNADESTILISRDEAAQDQPKFKKLAWRGIKLMMLMVLFAILAFTAQIYFELHALVYVAVAFLITAVVVGGWGAHEDGKSDKAKKLLWVSKPYHEVDLTSGYVPSPTQLDIYCKYCKQADEWRVNALSFKPYLTVGDALAIEALGTYFLSRHRLNSIVNLTETYSSNSLFVDQKA